MFSVFSTLSQAPSVFNEVSKNVENANRFQRSASYINNSFFDNDPNSRLNFQLKEKCQRKLDSYKLQTFLFILIPLLMILIGVFTKIENLFLYGFLFLFLVIPIIWYRQWQITKKNIKMLSTPPPITEQKCNWILD